MDGLAYGFSLKDTVDELISRVRGQLSSLQKPDGHFVFELEADATIPAEYVMLHHYLGENDREVEAEIGTYLRAGQGEHGGWSLFHDGDFDMSASVKAYYALKLIGDDPEAPHMRRARAAILARGGAARCNVLTRFLLALYAQIPWRGVPVMLVEVMLLPRWFPFHLSKVSYWSRTTLVPMLILQALKPAPRNGGTDIRELFTVPPELERRYNVNPTGSVWGDILLGLDTLLHPLERIMPRPFRQRAIDKAMTFITERLNGEDGLGAIFPPMAFLVVAYDALGYPKDHPEFATARRAVDKLLIRNKNGAGYCQPCVSPVWDTSLAAHALLEAGEPVDGHVVRGALDWLRDRQILDHVGDWADSAPKGLRPGGWAFQYGNDFYPDVDDTAVVGMALHRTGDERYRNAWERAAEWVIGMQSKNGGWGAYDADNTHDYLDHIPFADHGALRDPPTADVSARCVGFLAQLGYGLDHPAVSKGVNYLLKDQEPDGSWFGRWGTNYVYGTWSVLCALNAVGLDHDHPAISKAADWLLAHQRPDGGWGEDCATYWAEHKTEVKASTPSQTAWALLGLMAAGKVEHDAVRRGIAFLESAPRTGARWDEKLYTGVGFPRVFYLRYHGYAAYFPLWAVARYKDLMNRNDRRVAYGM